MTFMRKSKMWKAIHGFFVRTEANNIRKKLRNMELCGGDLDSPLWGTHTRRQKTRVMVAEPVYEPTEITIPITFEAKQKMAYWLASCEGFTKASEHYWYLAEAYFNFHGFTAHDAHIIGYDYGH